ncbi:hypothetical protein SASK131_16990 [Staphylococcus argenteus]|nr:hypothetical protein TMSFP064_01900 [Staphylococcus argenteus]BCN89815.1 hypothetical protein TMSFP069_01900 [Staphylococcus argenteus]GJF39547.1 hypothetical protein SA19056_17540 [Staphylococcus argenteus]GJF42215.1 hypothetical protein SA19059_18670 [Staphylococcus argenteus]GJF47278.1 hypothetical protein SA19080_17940 [Staphylococcus argenteus]
MPLGFFEVDFNGHDNLAKIGMCMLKMYSKNTKYKIQKYMRKIQLLYFKRLKSQKI